MSCSGRDSSLAVSNARSAPAGPNISCRNAIPLSKVSLSVMRHLLSSLITHQVLGPRQDRLGVILRLTERIARADPTLVRKLDERCVASQLRAQLGGDGCILRDQSDLEAGVVGLRHDE